MYFEGTDNPFAVFFQHNIRKRMFSPRHNSLYIWWNYFGTWLFGDWYSSPVFLNVGLTFIGGVFVYRLSVLSGFSPIYSRALSVFYLLHWDVLAWSSFPNLKEILIQVLSLGAWYGLILLSRPGCRLRGFFLGCSMLSILLFSRYHVPFLIIFVYILYSVLHVRKRSSYLMAFGIGLVSLLIFPDYVLGKYLRYIVDLKSVAIYCLKFLLSPQPWSLSDKNFWQVFSSVLHLLFIVPCVVAIPKLWRHEVTRYFILYTAVLLVFYSFIGYGQQRQRIQIAWIFVWAQFHFIILYNRFMFLGRRVS